SLSRYQGCDGCRPWICSTIHTSPSLMTNLGTEESLIRRHWISDCLIRSQGTPTTASGMALMVVEMTVVSAVGRVWCNCRIFRLTAIDSCSEWQRHDGWLSIGGTCHRLRVTSRALIAMMIASSCNFYSAKRISHSSN
ncbi:hypothetical protein BGX29_003654, partial [Mortierella sp. GBA35]